MNRVTYENQDGTFGINGVNLSNQPLPVQNAFKKLLNYERTGLEPEQIEQVDKLYREKCEEVARLEQNCGIRNRRYEKGKEIHNACNNEDS